jgi:hypothetical protein
MARSSRQEPRRPLLPTSARTHALLAELAEHPQVDGCFIGHRRKDGRATRTLAVICAVCEKRPRAKVAKEHLLPRKVEWAVNSRETASLRTDVQELGESGFQTTGTVATAGPGDRIEGLSVAAGQTEAVVATVGIALQHPRFGRVITTAGHAVQSEPGTVEFDAAQRPTVTLRNVAADGTRSGFTGRLLRSARIPQGDYALIEVEEATPVGNLYHDLNSLGGLHLPQVEDVGKTFFALTSAAVLPARVRGVFGMFTIGDFSMRDLILTDAVTEGGDSGCALVDESFRVAGLLVGFVTIEGERRSVFMSAFWALTLEQSELL